MRSRIISFATLALCTAALAQDPPARVARLSFLEGPVSFQPGTGEDWSAATLNYPLTTGDHLFADVNATAEIGIGPNFIRVGHQTNFGFLNLDDRAVQIRHTEGSLILKLRDLSDGDVWEVDTPNGAISLLRTGDYRVDTDPNRNATMVTVRSGDAEISANGQSFPVHSGQTGYFTGEGLQQNVQSANPPDDFDRFSADRDRLENAPPPQYVSENMVGYEDLNQYGTWEPESEYGPVWHPRVAAGWAPYHDGRWVWREPWGWTWVDEAPWGFAPFHYGRWAYIRGSWGWCPGPVRIARPVYAPALVAFVGGSSFSVSGGVGWFPLGPREIYTPAYRVSPAYIRRVNITDVREGNRNVASIYINRNAPGAFTAVSREDFVSARPVRRGTPVNSEQFRSAPVAGFTPGFAPRRDSVVIRTGGPVARPRDFVYNRQVIARRPPPEGSVPFSVRQQALQENGGRPLAPEQLNSIRRQNQETRQPQVRLASPPVADPQPRPVGNRDRFGSRPPQQVPQASTPQPAPQPTQRDESRSFGRQERSPIPRPEATVPQPTPEQRGSGRAEQRAGPPVAAPPAERPAENRNFGRERPQAEAPRQERPREERPREERAKPERQKEERKPTSN